MYICSFTTGILDKLSTWCFERYGDISCPLLVNPNHTDESWAVLLNKDISSHTFKVGICLNICMYIYIY